jgi:hypothetical protein
MNVSASKLDACSRFSIGSRGIDKASVDAMCDSDIVGAAIYDMVIVSKPSIMMMLSESNRS